MKYKNNTTYHGVYGGIRVNFSLKNLTQEVVEKFNRALVEEAMKRERLDRRPAVGVATSGGV